MEMKDRIVVITGGSGGIGQAMARAFLTEGAKQIVLADLHEDAVQAAANDIGCIGIACDVTSESDIQSVVEQTIAREGHIDLFCSNAGAGGAGLLTDATNEVWQNQWELHVMSHLYAARAVLPSMIARGEGYLLNTASAAGLLAAMGSGPYTVTKAAAVTMPTQRPRVMPAAASPNSNSLGPKGGISKSTILPCTFETTSEDDVLAKAF